MRYFLLLVLLHQFWLTVIECNTLDITDVRLADGSGPFEGRVEVQIDGVWGTICHNGFNEYDARPICRTMGLKYTAYFAGAHFGEGIGPIFANELICRGSESHVRECQYKTNTFCSHRNDIGIICTECGEIRVSYGRVHSVSADGTILKISCSSGYEINKNTTTCLNGSWSEQSMTCTRIPIDNDHQLNISDIKLVNGIGISDGRVEILVNDTWGTVCLHNFGADDARVVCKMLGFPDYYQIYRSHSPYGVGTGPIYINNLDCSGTESHINNCTYQTARACRHYEDVAVNCKYSFNTTDIRLADGTPPNSGRLEIFVNGTWGTVCSKYVSNAYVSSDVMDTYCRMLGYNLTMYNTSAIYGEGSGLILKGDSTCGGPKYSINDCTTYPPQKSYCSHRYDVSLVCTPCGLPDIPNGYLYSVNGTEFITKCNDGYILKDFKLQCLSNGTWINEDICTSKYAYPLDIDDIRLVGYRYHTYGEEIPYEGRIELLVNGSWGTVCGNKFNITSAAVICRMIGLELDRYYIDRYSRNSGRIYVENLECSGSENHINNCSYNVENTCTHAEDVSVVCTGYHLNITNIRLAGTAGPYHGRVEIEVNGTWGTVSDDYFDSADGQVVCRMLGLEYNRVVYRTPYGQGSGPIYVDRLLCRGSETHINQCRYIVDNYYNKQHNEDVSVICLGRPLNITDGRLSNGTGAYDGRAEIKVGDTWGTICDENFGIADADAFCRLLGLRAARFFTGGLYGEGSGPIFIDQLFCDENNVDLGSCRYLFLNECSHDQDVSVVCNECGQPDIYYWDVGYFSYNGTTLYADCSYYRTYIGQLELTCDNITQTWIKKGECEEYRFPLNVTDIRLADGPSETNGRVEIKSLDVWGTICDDGFEKPAADAICYMIGYPPAFSHFPGAYYGEGSGPIFVDDLICSKNATHINNCTYNTYDNCYHSDDISVNCTDCGIPKPQNGSINSSATNYGAVVKVTCDEDFKLIGDQVIFCQISGTWSDSPKCKLIDCGDPTPDHGSSNASETIIGTVVSVSCDEGYDMSGDAILTCQSDETWTDYTTCEIKDCGGVNITFAEVTLPDNKTTYGETARIDCWPGYILSGNPTVSCLSDGTWETLPTCEIVDCGDPVPYNAVANSTETTFNSVVEITCDPGQNITGNSTIICQEDGTWTDNPVCNIKDCGVLSIPNGNVSDSQGTLVGSVATIECERGYQLKGTSLARCLESDKGVTWDYSATCAKQVCGDPTPVNGIISGGDGKFEYENYAEIDCNIGYNIVGDNVIVCEDGGRWSDTPRCEIVECEDLTEPQNGYVNTSQGSIYSAKTFFSCKEDYLLVGEEMSVCEEDGKWSNKPPTCVAKSRVGGSCINEKYCLMEDSKCVNDVCTCITGIYDSRTKKCDTMPLMPFGALEGDVSVPINHKCGPKISFEPGFPLFGKMHTDLFVCVFGFVSFGDVYTNPTPPKTKNELHTLRDNRTILAPFYAQIDRQKSGPVWYRTYDILNSPEKMRDEVETISFIENIVVKFEKLESFEASFILVATWHDSKTKAPGFDRTKTSTFQAVLITDGKSTYTLFIYGNGMMQWVNKISENPVVWIGFAINSVIKTNAYSFSNAALQLDSKFSVSASENDVAGLIYQSLKKPDQIVKNPAVDCIRWYNNNFKDKKRIDYIASLMPECPCDIRLARFDPFFWHIIRHVRWGGKYACVDMLHVGNFANYGKSCCYDLKTWLWVYERPLAGGFQLYSVRHNRTKHNINDVKPKLSCCANSGHCNLFYELRPIGSCYRRSPYNFGSFWGDPHFRTLDGMNFTFNGLGEYTLLQINADNCTFDLQARTERAVKENGELSDATVFSAFAAKDSTGSTVHVERNMKRDGMNLYGNKIDLTRQLYSNSDPDDPFLWTSTDSNLTISKRNQSVNVFFPSCGISLMVSISVEMLTLTTFVPKALKNKTKGLLGNYDDDPYNDFTLPNGTVLNANITERDIFHYGKTWSINSNESAFVYEVGKSHEDYHNDTYQPRFLDDVGEILLAKAVQLCNGVHNRECIFDYVFTEKEEIANETQNFKLNTEADKVEIDESIPTLVGCSAVIAMKGKTVSCKYNSSDNVYFVSNTTDAKIDAVASAITYVQKTDEPVDIRISSRNQNGRSSPIFVIGVILCTKCSGHGVCKNVTRKDPRENEYFRYAACECDPQYEGDDCENELDGCSANPCSWNRTCEKLSADEQKALNKSHMCGPCPEGFNVSTDDEDECIDIDECADTNGGCEQNCTNLDGGFRCSCNDGYRTDVLDITQCRDINECDEAIHNCDQLCNNMEGSYECHCYNGYEYNTTAMSCLKLSGNSCTEEDMSQCAGGAKCAVDDGQPFCFCENGYELSDNKTCIDINECSRGVCSQDCMNTMGGFQCSCFKGYRLESVATCTECDVLHWGNNCEQICACNGRGADRCDPVKGCICSVGWNGTSCNDDINECKIFDQACDDARKECVNTLGSYSCECKKGFYETEEGTCEDVDECSDPELNTCDQKCENTVTGFICSCRDGYTKLNNTTCIDIDECELGTTNCEQRCANSDGSYSCFCHYGYILNDDRRTCSKVSDPCWTLRNLNCSHFCQMEDDIAECKCQHGYMLESDNETCTDINECTDSNKNRCDEDTTCTNTDGSYQCKCPTGKRLENDGRTCSECDDFHFGENCAQTCSCLNGACDRKTGCVCDPGWAGNQCDIDIDECATGQVVCSSENAVCVNILGSAFCSCETGYTNVSGVCQDIDECAADLCDQNCVNTVGSFYCTCENGFILDDGCIDIDECRGSHGCDQICQNIVGSYRCLCEDGFRLNLNDRHTCIAENECSEEEIGSCTDNSYCYISKGKADCKCLKGYQNVTGRCEDIDECLSNPCSQNCSNTKGFFECRCHEGYSLSSDGVTCQDCSSWMYGYNCSSSCHCNRQNSKDCNHVTGTCTCKKGWTGIRCDEDVNECNNAAVCPTNSSCENRNGSFTCTCGTGFFKAGNGICTECDKRHFGYNCFNECMCDFENTDDCQHETGHCICNQGWTGTNCTDDINECDVRPDICDGKPNSTCKNNIGSYICECDDGYQEINGTCEDKNECMDMTINKCQQICVIKPGTFVCQCKDGFQLLNDSVSCSDIDECGENTDVCNQTCNNSVGSYSCSCGSGYKLAKDGFSCDDINECDGNITLCNQTCTNSVGSYSCLCASGFRLAIDGFSCNDIDECANGTDLCNQTCSNSAGSYTCSCSSGFNLGKDGISCDDIDECDEKKDLCNQTCTNSVGSYSCSCESGYNLAMDGFSCNVCENGYYGYNCSEVCQCMEENTESCHHLNGNCTCKKGWKGTNCSVDINECEASDDMCLSKMNSTCENKNGSYLCTCDTGFRDQGDICTDCEKWMYGASCLSQCHCDQTKSKYCHPETGECVCEPGWNGTKCEDDIDECKDTNSCPEHSTCRNINGSFNCKCNTGYMDTESGKCEVCENGYFGNNCSEVCQCLEMNTELCHHLSGNCTCKVGWMGTTCSTDINECEADDDVCVNKVNSTCENRNGSYLCTCDSGFQEQGDICAVCENGYFGNNCSEVCQCLEKNTELCHHLNGNCTCKEGWMGTTCSTDIDECEADDDVCVNKVNSTCENRNGSYLCTCDPGFQEQGDICAVCENGYFGDKCSDVCQCIEQNTEYCDHLTGNCTCKKGWMGTTCSSDINECEVSNDVCVNKVNSTCENTNGSYLCTCDPGFREQGELCTDCAHWMYGAACRSECKCDKTKSKYCHPETGVCICESGWNGTYCEDDIDECKDNDSCPEHSTCINNNGGFSCKCNTGYMDSENGMCKECTDNTFGEICTTKCKCLAANSEKEEQTCDIVTGECICKSNWQGQTCSEDVDECAIDLTVCKDEDNKVCVNTNGSYECDCIRGYTISVDGSCVEDKSQTVQNPDGEDIINVIVVINVDLPLGTNLNASSTYTYLRDKYVASMQEFLKRFTRSLMQIIVHDIWFGSMVVNSSIVPSEKSDTVESKLYEAVVELQDGSHIIFDGKNVSVSSDSYKNLGPCEFYQEINGKCPDGYTCEVENTVPSCKLIRKKNRDNWSLIIGLSAGGLFILIVSAILVVLVKMIKSRRTKTEHTRQRQYRTHGALKETKPTSDFSSMHSYDRGEIAGLERTLPTWRTNYTRSSMSNAYGQSHSYDFPYHIPRAKQTRLNEDTENYFY